ncbi:regulator component [Streptomyces johnsoniae]|uniref:Regulator component n=1 Tax=Streptomyces johnsoniae TaxID=3075532 RepID=A0ABU2SCY4_9ACTN|nr:regulator component [Streptomyces sp. DSM 41886]MDT0446831.1 regulator component [Streptomyces sp. DSM 41886]
MTTAHEYTYLRARCQNILNVMRVPRPYSLESIVRWMETLRGRPLVLMELPGQVARAGVCGLWLGTDDADFVFYEARTAPLHREHIILHEIAHMLVAHHRAPHGSGGGQAEEADGHDGDDGLGGELGALLSGLQPHLVRRLMTRTSYTSAEEQEAEVLATLMRRRREAPSGEGFGRLRALFGVRADDRH